MNVQMRQASALEVVARKVALDRVSIRKKHHSTLFGILGIHTCAPLSCRPTLFVFDGQGRPVSCPRSALPPYRSNTRSKPVRRPSAASAPLLDPTAPSAKPAVSCMSCVPERLWTVTPGIPRIGAMPLREIIVRRQIIATLGILFRVSFVRSHLSNVERGECLFRLI